MINESTFLEHESNVRTYCRSFPTVFTRADGHLLTDELGNRYIDFLAGAGSLNYGHNNPVIMEAILTYMRDGGVIHSLDLYTAAKRQFIEAFVETILRPRGLTYKLQFPGPTGTNAVEAALKVARKATRRWNVISFSNSYHGMSLGSLSATANPAKRSGAGIPLSGVTSMPYDGFFDQDISTLPYIEKMLTSPGSGVEPPAGILLEVVQGEGGLNAASWAWLQGLAAIARRCGVPLIVDDIQAGCGRTGTFFSFEPYGIVPDVVCLSKSLSGSGLPLSLVLLKPELDLWAPGEHNGTFRGNNLGFVGATAALTHYWRDDRFQSEVAQKAAYVRLALEEIAALFPAGEARVKGKGLMIGLEINRPGMADAVSERAFRHGLVVETCGVNSHVLKLLPPLTTPNEALKEGLSILSHSVRELLAEGSLGEVAASVGTV